MITLERLRGTGGGSACPGCGKMMRRSQLKIHMRNKTCEAFAHQLGDLPASAKLGRVQCPGDGCSHVSPNLKALRKHYASKHGEKVSCAKCGKSYGRSDALRKHERSCGAYPARPGSPWCPAAPRGRPALGWTRPTARAPRSPAHAAARRICAFAARLRLPAASGGARVRQSELTVSLVSPRSQA